MARTGKSDIATYGSKGYWHNFGESKATTGSKAMGYSQLDTAQTELLKLNSEITKCMCLLS